MYRLQIKALTAWKTSKNRKPLIIRGARQVGKTWLMKEFGQQYYKQICYINFEKNSRLRLLFNDGIDIGRILDGIQLETGITIHAKDTLLIFDEIQSAPEAITALKYFYEDVPQYHIIAAGSLLGIAIQNHVSFPVGKVDFLDLYPLSFIEFLEAVGHGDLVKTLHKRDWKLIHTFKSKYIELLRQYYYIGGMPEVVVRYVKNKNFKEVRQVQQQILKAYENDFSKHAPVTIVPRIRMLWNSIPAQLAKENKKFIYGMLKQGARAKDFEIALAWLIDCGLLYKVNRVSKPSLPLKAYEDMTAFKLFLVDIGLLVAMSELNQKTLLQGNLIFTEFKGALTEQYVLNSLLVNASNTFYYWSSERSESEVDFVIQFEGNNIPIEVKAEVNLQAKSIKVYNEKFKPVKALRFSMSDYIEQESLVNIPLYAISEMENILVKFLK